MPEPFQIEFAGLSDAREMREQHADALADTDDKRSKVVRFRENELADHDVEEIVAVAEAGRADREGAGQATLTDHERDRIDFSEGRANVPHARSVKALMHSEGVDDWVAYYDPTLTVDEHREVAERAARDERGQRLDEPEPGPAGDMERAVADRCDHARDHCKHGDPDACEFLGEACGFEEEQIATIMGDDTEASTEAGETAFSGAQLGALRRAWDGYQGAIDDLEAALGAVERAEEHATDAFEAINAIRRDAGQEPIDPERLNEIRDLHMSEVCESTGSQLQRAVRGDVVDETVP